MVKPISVNTRYHFQQKGEAQTLCGGRTVWDGSYGPVSHRLVGAKTAVCAGHVWGSIHRAWAREAVRWCMLWCHPPGSHCWLGLPTCSGRTEPGRAPWQPRARGGRHRYRWSCSSRRRPPCTGRCPLSPQPRQGRSSGVCFVSQPHTGSVPAPGASASSSWLPYSLLQRSDKEPLSHAFNSSAHCLAMPPWSLCRILYKKINWMPEVAEPWSAFQPLRLIWSVCLAAGVPQTCRRHNYSFLLSNMKLPQRQR